MATESKAGVMTARSKLEKVLADLVNTIANSQTTPLRNPGQGRGDEFGSVNEPEEGGRSSLPQGLIGRAER